MELNEGLVDRAIRALLGLVLVAGAAMGLIGPWGWIGVVPLATGLAGWCPLYWMLGFNTCGVRT